MSLGTFALDSKGQEILPSKRPEMPGMEFETIPYRYDSLEQAHNAIGNSALATLPSLQIISEVKTETVEVSKVEEIKKPIITNSNRGKSNR